MSTSLVTLHKTGLPTDANDKISIFGCEPSAGGAHATYRIGHLDSPDHIELIFQTLERNGITNEALLAIVIDRLTAFQAGPFSCIENSEALVGLTRALRALQRRTSRRITQGTEGKLVEAKEDTESKARVTTDGEKLTVGQITVNVDELRSWSNWSIIESAAKRLNPKITAYELSVLEDISGKCGSGGKNGFSELKSALANMG